MFRRMCQAMVMVSMALGFAEPASAFCPCWGEPSTLSEQFDDADVVYLARWVSQVSLETVEDGEQELSSSTTLEILDVIKPGSPILPRGSLVTVEYLEAKPGDTFLLIGETIRYDEDELDIEFPEGVGDDDEVEVRSPLESAPEPEQVWTPWRMSRAAVQYVLDAPKRASEEAPVSPAARLSYFVPYLGHDDETIADDAYQELASASWQELAEISAEFPRVRLRQWLQDDDLDTGHLNLFGMMLALCGIQADAALLQAIIERHQNDEYLSLEGLMTAYLVLGREQGLEFLRREFLENHAAQEWGIYCVLSSLQIQQTEFPDVLSRDRALEVVRLLLDRPEFVAYALHILESLKDWESQSRVLALMDSCGYEDENIRQAIASYLEQSVQLMPGQTDTPENVRTRSHLERWKREHPDWFCSDPFGVDLITDFEDELDLKAGEIDDAPRAP